VRLSTESRKVQTDVVSTSDSLLEEIGRNTVRRLISPRTWRVWHNFPQKIGALVVSVLLWFAATTDRRANITRNLEVPIEVIGLGNDRILTDLPKTIKLELQGAKARVETLEGKDVAASLDVTDLENGFFTHVLKITLPDGVLRSSNQAVTVNGSLNQLARETVTVRIAALEPTPALPGGVLEPKLLRATPDEVTMIGAQEALDRVAYALALTPKNPGIGRSIEVRLLAVDPQGRVVDGVRLEPVKVKVAR
jgi:YbbR domain-containing protein